MISLITPWTPPPFLLESTLFRLVTAMDVPLAPLPLYFINWVPSTSTKFHPSTRTALEIPLLPFLSKDTKAKVCILFLCTFSIYCILSNAALMIFLTHIGPYQFQIDSQSWINASLGTTDYNFTGVGSGTHTITIKDTNMCQKSILVTTTQPPVLQVQVLSYDPILCWAPTVDLSVGGIGGTSPYVFG